MDTEKIPEHLIAYDGNGNKYKMDYTGRCGGEGCIYRIQKERSECAKIYHQEKITRELHEKISTMVNNPPNDPMLNKGHRSITWPSTILYNEKTDFIGYKMPYLDPKIFEESNRYYTKSDRLRKFGGNFTWQYLFRCAYNIVSAVAAIHEKGHRIGDLRDSNILVSSETALATLIDCDSFQIHDKSSEKVFYTRVGIEEYLPPELLIGANFKDIDIDRYPSDLFALGILIFKFLMNGLHPYQARGPLVDDADTNADKIRKGYFPYAGIYSGVKPPVFALPYDIIPPSIQNLFSKCFVDGNKKREERPDAIEWLNTLKKEESKLRKCSANKNHWYSSHLSYCPWCKIAEETGEDPYPNPELKCPKCGHVNDANEIYCQRCEYQISGMRTCPNPYCKRDIPTKSLYCRECGHQL